MPNLTPLRFCTVSLKFHRKLEHRILVREITLAQKYHPEALPTIQMEYDNNP